MSLTQRIGRLEARRARRHGGAVTTMLVVEPDGDLEAQERGTLQAAGMVEAIQAARRAQGLGLLTLHATVDTDGHVTIQPPAGGVTSPPCWCGATHEHAC